MSNHNGNANKMVGEDHLPNTGKMVSDTPRTDAVQYELLDQDTYTSWLETTQFARQLERELNAANDKIKRLEEVGDEMATWLSSSRNLGDDPFMSHQWRKAKEANP